MDLPTSEDPVRLVCGDGFAVLRDLSDRAVGHVITDPPYAEKTHAGARTENHTTAVAPGKRYGSHALVDFASFDDETFLTLCDEAVRVARRWVLMTCDWRHSAAAECGGRPVVRCGVWIKPDSAPQFTGDRPGTGWEAVLILHRQGRKRWNGGGHHAVWTHPIERDGDHPAQKPLPLVRRWLKDFRQRHDRRGLRPDRPAVHRDRTGPRPLQDGHEADQRRPRGRRPVRPHEAGDDGPIHGARLMPAMIFILVERSEGGWVATARDEVGTIATVVHDRRARAVESARLQAVRLVGPCRVKVEGLTDGEGE
jgi:site-specific DNA-methyltransferase (adenine-specific)